MNGAIVEGMKIVAKAAVPVVAGVASEVPVLGVIGISVAAGAVGAVILVGGITYGGLWLMERFRLRPVW